MIKKIETKEETEKREKRNKKIIGIFIIALMVFSTAGYAFFSNSGNSDDSNEIQDNFNGRYWIYNFGGQDFYFTNNKDSLQNISVQISNRLGDYSNSRIYVDSKNDFVLNEIAINLERYSSIQKACYGACEEDLPEKTCEDNLIIFRESENSRVYQEGKCVFIDGSNDMKAVDSFLNKLISE